MKNGNIDIEIIKQIDEQNRYLETHYMVQDKESLDLVTQLKVIISKCSDLKYHKGLFTAYQTMGAHYIVDNNPEEALAYLKKAKTLIDYRLVSESLYGEIANAYIMYYTDLAFDYGQATKYYKLGMKHATKASNFFDIVNLKCNFALMNIRTENYEEGISLLHDGLDYYIKSDQRLYLMFVESGLGDGYLGLEDYESAFDHYTKAYHLSIEFEDISVESSSAFGLSTLLVLDGKIDEGIKLIRKTMEKAHKIDSPAELNVVTELGKTFYELGLYTEAYEELYKSRNLIERCAEKEVIYNYYTIYSQVCEKLHKYKYAYKYKTLAHDMYKTFPSSNIPLQHGEIISESYKERINLLKTLSNIGHDITTSISLDDVVVELNIRLKDIMVVDSIGIGEIRNDNIFMNHYFIEGLKMEPMIRSISDKSVLASWIIRNDEELLFRDLPKEYSRYINAVESTYVDTETDKSLPLKFISSNNEVGNTIKSVMYKTLKFKDEIIGVFTLQAYQDDVYGSEELEIFRIISTYVSVALKNLIQANALIDLSMRDHLTGLYNRRGFVDMYNVLLLDKNIDVTSSSLIMLDIDHFKKINDDYGHVMGDKVLTSLGQILSSMDDDLLYPSRLGGEEFGFIVLNKTVDEVTALAELVRKSIDDLRLSFDKQTVHFTASIGVSHCACDTIQDYIKMYHKADTMLYKAKEERNKMLIEVID